MGLSNRAFLVAAVFVIVYALAYLISIWIEVPVPRYYPIEGGWKLERVAGVPSQARYGRLVLALVMGGLAASFLVVALRRSNSDPSPTLLRSLGIGSAAVVVA